MDVGWGELLLLAAVALLIFGPEKLPKAAADAGRMVRKLKEMASTAQQDLTPDLDLDGIKADLRSMSDLHPKRIISSALSDQPSSPKKVTASPAPTADPLSDSRVSSPAPRTASPRLDPDAT